jgi:hypothetical protein
VGFLPLFMHISVFYLLQLVKYYFQKGKREDYMSSKILCSRSILFAQLQLSMATFCRLYLLMVSSCWLWPNCSEGAACQMLNLLPTSRGYTSISDSYSPLELRPDPPTLLLWASNCVSTSVSLLWRIFVTWQPKKLVLLLIHRIVLKKKVPKVTKFTEFFYTEITIIGSSMLPKYSRILLKFLLSSLTCMY